MATKKRVKKPDGGQYAVACRRGLWAVGGGYTLRLDRVAWVGLEAGKLFRGRDDHQLVKRSWVEKNSALQVDYEKLARLVRDQGR